MGVADIDAFERLDLCEIEAESLECALELAGGAVGDLVPGLLAADVEAAEVGVLLAPAVDFDIDLAARIDGVYGLEFPGLETLNDLA